MSYAYPKRIEQVDGGFIVSDADVARARTSVHATIDEALAELKKRFEVEKDNQRYGN